MKNFVYIICWKTHKLPSWPSRSAHDRQNPPWAVGRTLSGSRFSPANTVLVFGRTRPSCTFPLLPCTCLVHVSRHTATLLGTQSRDNIHQTQCRCSRPSRQCTIRTRTPLPEPSTTPTPTATTQTQGNTIRPPQTDISRRAT